ncbi:MAG: ATP phosphoribosyltransferase regulatory subunit [Clostridiales bacterium]|jgi:ATP phosphoribosyltransferase regulatory subunit|nr:ATP phosphoribosyltransferase regulatory subunit [Clostridiales bacterium]
MNEKVKRLLTPEGVQDLLPGLAGQKREVERGIQEIFGRWGYREVSTPAFEYSANFVGDMKAELEDKTYRFSDERGRSLVLRPDFTLPLARVAATYLAGEVKPLRLCYGGNIYRYASSRQGKQRELAQAGVELIGCAGAGSDAEVIALAAGVLKELGLSEFTLCLGHVGFLQKLLDSYGVEQEAGDQIKDFFNKKDFVSLKDMVNSLPLSETIKENILRIPALRGGKEVLSEAAGMAPEGAAHDSLDTLAEIWQALDDYGVSSFITLDLGLVRTMEYYTGMVFEGYTTGMGYPICGGGRYDQLLGNFGPEQPAVGFALNLDHLLDVLQRIKKLPAVSGFTYMAYEQGSRQRAFAAALELRAQGQKVVVDTEYRTKDDALCESKARGALRMLYFISEVAEDEVVSGEDETTC